jgi:hypothetical protein
MGRYTHCTSWDFLLQLLQDGGGIQRILRMRYWKQAIQETERCNETYVSHRRASCEDVIKW